MLSDRLVIILGHSLHSMDVVLIAIPQSLSSDIQEISASPKAMRLRTFVNNKCK